MNRTAVYLFSLLLIASLAACTDVVPTDSDDIGITGGGWGVSDAGPGGDPTRGQDTLNSPPNDGAEGTDDADQGATTDAASGGGDGGAGQDPEIAPADGVPCGDVFCAPGEICNVDGLCEDPGADPCDPNPCVDVPPAECSVDGHQVVYAGVCALANGAVTCSYPAATTPCAENTVCAAGACAPTCLEGPDSVPCPDGQLCTDDGECVDEPPPTCCEQLFCNPAFEECLPTDDGEDCYCDPIYELCLFMGDNCPVGYNQPEPYTCVDYGGQDGICRIACEGPSVGEPDTCDGEEWLCGALPGYDGYCLPADCSGYFDNDFDACGPDATCLPTLDGTNVCVPDGPDDLGDACGLHNECAHGLLCIDNTCQQGECSVDSNQVPCDDGISCLPWTIGVDDLPVGNCAVDCFAFTDLGCEADEWCFPLANTPDGGPVDGYCVPSGGTAFEGMKCDLDPNACVDGTMCVVSPENEDPTCEPLCTPEADPGDPGSCQQGRGCSPLFMVNEWGEVVEIMDYGSCIPACSPWVDHDDSGCGPDNWCEPMLFNSLAGECKGFFGELSEGDPCTEVGAANSCGEGLFCLGFMTQLGMDGICHRLCDVDGGIGATCAQDQLCDELVFTGANDKQFSVAVGVCAPNPDWVPPGEDGCPDGEMLDCNQLCVGAMLLGNGTCDVALDCEATAWDQGDCPADP